MWHMKFSWFDPFLPVLISYHHFPLKVYSSNSRTSVDSCQWPCCPHATCLPVLSLCPHPRVWLADSCWLFKSQFTCHSPGHLLLVPFHRESQSLIPLYHHWKIHRASRCPYHPTQHYECGHVCLLNCTLSSWGLDSVPFTCVPQSWKGAATH